MSAPTDAGRGSRPPLIRRLVDRVTFASEEADEPPMLTRMRRGNLPSLAPEVGSAVSAVRTQMGQLARKGALDEGNGGVMDVAIDAWVEQWHNDIDNEHDARQSELQLLETEAAAELERRRTLLGVMRADFDAVNEEIALLTTVADRPGPPRRRVRRLFGFLRRRKAREPAEETVPIPTVEEQPNPAPAGHPPYDQQYSGRRREPKATEPRDPTAEEI